MTPPPNETQTTDETQRANDRMQQQRRERAIAARVWLERAMRALETDLPEESEM